MSCSLPPKWKTRLPTSSLSFDTTFNLGYRDSAQMFDPCCSERRHAASSIADDAFVINEASIKRRGKNVWIPKLHQSI